MIGDSICNGHTGVVEIDGLCRDRVLENDTIGWESGNKDRCQCNIVENLPLGESGEDAACSSFQSQFLCFRLVVCTGRSRLDHLPEVFKGICQRHG